MPNQLFCVLFRLYPTTALTTISRLLRGVRQHSHLRRPFYCMEVDQEDEMDPVK